MPRFHIEASPGLATGVELTLSEGVSRHVQVLRLQPGDDVHLFDGGGQEWRAAVVEMGRKRVSVRLEAPVDNDRELPVAVTLAVGMPANDRMDFVVEKATELGVRAIQPLMCERSVLRLDGDRALKKVTHWQAVAVAAAEQCGRSVVPEIHPVMTLGAWLKAEADGAALGSRPARHRAVLSLREAVPMSDWLGEQPQVVLRAAPSEEARGGRQRNGESTTQFVFLNGPEGGLAHAEEEAALRAGWRPVSLGRRVLRADTAPLAALSVIAARYEF